MKPGGDGMTQVRCSVDTCQYWGEGQVCRA
ncbi:MAG: DUF1540 domain-containing protein, partial [Firmicutes bacterium]|nr:DUF1540 domain-containing protein [Bacillota bacterium]